MIKKMERNGITKSREKLVENVFFPCSEVQPVV